jgi:hypothetical protein
MRFGGNFMWNILRNLSAPALNVADKFARNQTAAAIRRTGLPVLRAARNPNNSNLTRNLAAAQLVSNVPAIQGGAAIIGGGAAIDASNRTGFTGQIEGALNQVGPAVDRFFGAITPQAIQRFGREQENQSLIQALDPTFGLLSTVFPGTNPPQARPPMPGLPAGYKEQELAQGAAAERFRPGAGFPGQQADRAYEQEKSRVAQLTAQDPELKRYEEASKKAKTQEEMDAARDIGMAIWARTHGPGSKNNLAAKVKPGQSGYETIQKTLYPGGAPLPAMSAESEAMLNAIAPPDATGVRPNVTPMPGQLPAFGNASEAMFQAVTGGGSYITPMSQEAATPQTQAQDLAEAYRQAMLARILTNK